MSQKTMRIESDCCCFASGHWHCLDVQNVTINKLRAKQCRRYVRPTEVEFKLFGTPSTSINKRTRSLKRSMSIEHSYNELISSNLIAINIERTYSLPCVRISSNTERTTTNSVLQIVLNTFDYTKYWLVSTLYTPTRLIVHPRIYGDR